MILNIVSCNAMSLGQKCKKKETELDGMVFKGLLVSIALYLKGS